jgi:hypothetical protein
MNSRWRFDEMYKDHRDERKLKSPEEFKVQDRSHLAARISLAAYDLAFAIALRRMGRISATDRLRATLQMKKAVRCNTR